MVRGILFYKTISSFPEKISFKLSPLEKNCMKCQNLFSGDNIINLSSVDFAQRIVMVNLSFIN